MRLIRCFRHRSSNIWMFLFAHEPNKKDQLKSTPGRVLPSDLSDGERRRIAKKLDRLIQERFVEAYEDEGLKVPPVPPVLPKKATRNASS